MDPLRILNDARKAVPAVNYALAVAGIAAAGAIASIFVGRGPTGVILVGLVFVGMVLVFLFSSLIASPSSATRLAGTFLLWAVLFFFVIFLGLTVSVFLGYGPKPWADLLRVQSRDPQDVRVERINYLVTRSAPSLKKGESTQASQFFSDPRLNERQIDGCIISSFFPTQFGQQCRNEAQEVIATAFCRSMGYRFSASHNAKMFSEIHKALVLSVEEAPGDNLEMHWQPSDTSGFIFTQIECN